MSLDDFHPFLTPNLEIAPYLTGYRYGYLPNFP